MATPPGGLMTHHRLIDRRAAIRDLGKAGLAIVVFGTAACAPDATVSTSTTSPAASAPSTDASTSSTHGQTPTSSQGSTTVTTTGQNPTSFTRVDLGFVSAYVLFRAGEAVLVDTGVGGSAGAIEAALAEASLDWGSVGQVVLTHKHPDHVGSLDAVMERAAGATVYAGAADISAIDAPTTPRPVGDGDRVFGLDIIESPGHTPGHISVLDAVAGVLVAGDALNGTGGSVTGPDPDFSEDMTAALDSVRKLAGFEYEVALFGHGEPVLENAAESVANLAQSLG